MARLFSARKVVTCLSAAVLLCLGPSSHAFRPNSRQRCLSSLVFLSKHQQLGAGGATPPRQSNKVSITSLAQAAWPLRDDPKGMPPEFPVFLARIGITTSSTVLTWFAAQQNKSGGAVLASSAVTLISSLIAPGLGQAAMCGTFAGMSSSASTLVAPSLLLAVVLGFLTTALFELMIHTRNLYLGMGGRLGFIAFLGVNMMALIRGVPVLQASNASNALKNAPWLVMAGFGAMGSVATIALREVSDDSAAADPVRAAAVIGLLAALLVGFGGFTRVGALAVYGGAFVGMSLPSRLMRGRVPGKQVSAATAAAAPSAARLLASFAMAGALGGLVHAATLGYGWWIGGWGGKAGFCSFVGVLLYRAMSKTTSTIKNLASKSTPDATS